MNEVTLHGLQLIVGKVYTFRYKCPAGIIDFTGAFESWDAMSDRFAFKNDDINPVTCVPEGNNILSIVEYECPAISCTGDSHEALTFGEVDPSGKDAHAPGAKLDAGKVFADAILAGFPRALWGVAEVGTFGANKYSLGGWTSVDDGIRRYRDAAARHRLKRQMGETIDPDSGLLHTYHEAWNVLASLELELREA